MPAYQNRYWQSNHLFTLIIFNAKIAGHKLAYRKAICSKQIMEFIKNYFNKNKKIIVPFIFLILLAIALRLVTFFSTSLLDNDEGYYLVMGENILKGSLPYREIWDNKGPLLYFLFAFIIKLSGHSLIVLRFFTIASIVSISFFIYLIGKKIYNSNLGLIAALFFILIVCSPALQALSSNSELFFLLPVISAIYLILFKEKNKQNLILAGILFGLSFNMKTIVIFDFIAASVFIAILSKQNKLFYNFKNFLFFLIGFIIPSLFFAFYFWRNDLLSSYLYIILNQNIRWATANFTSQFSLFEFIAICSLSIYPIALLAFSGIAYFAIRPNTFVRNRAEYFYFFVLWIFLIFFGIFLIKKLYPHHFLQAASAISVIGGFFSIKIYHWISNRNKRLFYSVFIGLFLLSLVLVNIFFQFRLLKNGDINKKISNEISLQPGEYIYSQLPMVYFLTKSKIPTKYAFPSFLTYSKYQKTFEREINISDETQKILDKKPAYFILGNIIVPKQIDEYTKNYCKLYKKIEDIKIFNCR